MYIAESLRGVNNIKLSGTTGKYKESFLFMYSLPLHMQLTLKVLIFKIILNCFKLYAFI
jgi:hypothetical protein